MEISEFAFKLLILFFPGIVCALIVDQLTIHRPTEVTFFLLRSFVLGIGCYFLYWVLLHGLHSRWPGTFSTSVAFFKAQTGSFSQSTFGEIVWVTLVAVGFACVISIFSRHKLINRAAAGLGITHKFWRT